ncbi:hypothetical protein [Aldersonia kunmingensis]|uniref:hypothetical protein n=1 Tax=Aldersonia kunmingensis TaxID=408066 RepID=UPI000830C3B9|nr:hypothetical protein [Aldersonia kunmingensis]
MKVPNLLLALIIPFAVVACGSQNATPAAPNAAAPQPPASFPSDNPVPLGTTVTVKEFDGTGYRAGGEMKLTVVSSGPGDPADTYSNEIPAGMKLTVIDVVAEQASGEPYFRSPAFVGITTGHAAAHSSDELYESEIAAGILLPSEIRNGQVGFMVPVDTEIDKVIWQDDADHQQAAWALK